MGHWEDLWYQIHDDIAAKGLKKEFSAQLKKMENQSKHKYIDTREKWSYAHSKVVKEYEKKRGKRVK